MLALTEQFLLVTTNMLAAILPEKSISAAIFKGKMSDKQKVSGTVFAAEGLDC